MLRIAVGGLVCVSMLGACGGGGGSAASSSSSSSSGGTANPLPVMAAQSFAGTEDTLFTGQLAATDAGDTLTFTAATNPTRGTIAVTSAGAFTYTPNINFSGADTFSARVADAANQAVTATITINVAGVNDPPTAVNDVLTVTTTNAVNVLSNDVDPDNENLAVTITSQPFTGAAVVNTDRTVNLQLPVGFKGFTKFSYRVTDAGNVTSDATALVYANLQPFKVVTVQPTPAGGGQSGIFVNDLMTSRLAHEATITYDAIQTDSTVIAQNGSGVAFRHNGPNGPELRYVDLANPGTSRLIHGPLPAPQNFEWVYMTSDGRFVVYEFRPDPSRPAKQLYVFDRDGTLLGQPMSLPQPLARIGMFNANGTAMYYAGMSSENPPWFSGVYRADLATRVTTPVSVTSAMQTYAFFWPLPDDTGYVDIRINNGVNSMGAYVTRNALPAGAAILHPPLANPNVYYPASLSPDGNYFVFTENTSSIVPVRMHIARTTSPGTTRLIGGPGWGTANESGSYGYRFDSQTMLVARERWLGGAPGVYEVPLANPEAPVAVYESPNSTSFSTWFTFPFYSADGERITYRHYYDATNVRLAVTRRGAFGQSTPLTPANAIAGNHAPDASGCVVLVSISISGTPDQAVLVNVDVPLALYPIGPSVYTRGFAIVRR